MLSNLGLTAFLGTLFYSKANASVGKNEEGVLMKSDRKATPSNRSAGPKQWYFCFS